MDPQATWEELLHCYTERRFEEAVEAAENLHQWLKRGGFAPQTLDVIAIDDELHRVTALAVIRHVLRCSK